MLKVWKQKLKLQYKILWIDNENFFFTNFTNQNELQDCEIYKYNINTNEIKLISKIKSLPIENYTPKFENDFSNKTFFKFGTILKEINNPENRKAELDIDKKIIYFLEHIRTEYLIDTSRLDEEFIQQVIGLFAEMRKAIIGTYNKYQ